MKINPDQSGAVKPDEERDVRQVRKSSERFEDLLSRAAEKMNAVSREQASRPPGQMMGPGPTMHLTAMQMLHPSAQAPATETKAMDTIDSLLSQWENYAHQLASSPHGLRNAHDTLNRISTEIGQLKANWPQDDQAAGPGADLRNMLNELEVMAVTERVKFDRGDYI